MAMWVRNAQHPGERFAKLSQLVTPVVESKSRQTNGGLMAIQYSPRGKLQVHCLKRIRLRATEEDTPIP